MKWQCWPQPFCVEGATDLLAPCVDAPDEGLAGAGVQRSADRFVWGSRAAGCLSGTKRQPSQRSTMPTRESSPGSGRLVSMVTSTPSGGQKRKRKPSDLLTGYSNTPLEQTWNGPRGEAPGASVFLVLCSGQAASTLGSLTTALSTCLTCRFLDSSTRVLIL